MKSRLLCLLFLPLWFVAVAQAATPEEAIRASLKVAMPKAVVTAVTATPIPGLYQVTATGYDTVYATADGRYLLEGDLLEVQGSRIVSVTDQSMVATRKKALAAVNPADMVIFPATGKTRAVVYVFTDADCPYCRKLHQEMPTLNKRGIEVRYLAFPRTGPGTPAAVKLAGIWCAKDRQATMTLAKHGGLVPPAPASCKAPVKEQFDLGVSLGVEGTPTVYAADGSELGGYLSADAMVKALGLD